MNNKNFLFYFAIAGVIIFLDQLSKQIAIANLSGQPPLEIFPFLSFALIFNEGAAFGFLNDAGGWQRYFLSALSATVSAVLIIWLWRSRRGLLCLALALVLGGAVGNLIDRVIQQQVTDFILLHYRHWYFPAFNLADAAITVGAVGLILDSLGLQRRTTRDEDL